MHHRRRPLGGGLVPRFFEIRQAARGRWPQLLRALGITDSYLTGRHGPCPGCGGKDRFRFDDQGIGRWFCSQGGGDPASGDGFDLLVHTGIATSAAAALALVQDALGLAPDPQARIRMFEGGRALPQRDGDAPQTEAAARFPDKSAPAQEMWHRAVQLTGTAGEVYLKSRRLDGPWPNALLWLPVDNHNAVNIGHGKVAGWAPVDSVGAILAGITSAETGMLVAVHRIFISLKAERVGDRKALGPVMGNACRLGSRPDERGHWAIAEGVETALAGRQLTGLPAWAAIAAGNMANITPPAGTLQATIWADNDAAGLAAAQKAATIWTADGIEVRIIAPDEPGADMNDLLRKGGTHAA